MINIDWKGRFDKDVKFFIDQRLPQADYDVGVIYRIYPIRDEGMVPLEVLEYIGKRVAKAGDLLVPDFFDYLWSKLGKEGKAILVIVFAEVVKKNGDFYQQTVVPYLEKAHGEILSLMIKKIVAPALKKDVAKGIDTIVMLAQKEQEEINKSLLTVLGSGFKKNPELIETCFAQLSGLISEGGEVTDKFFVDLFKKIAKLDAEIFTKIFCELSKTKDGHIVEVLSKSVFEKNEQINAEVDSWGVSGNAKIKKSFERAKKK